MRTRTWLSGRVDEDQKTGGLGRKDGTVDGHASKKLAVTFPDYLCFFVAVTWGPLRAGLSATTSPGKHPLLAYSRQTLVYRRGYAAWLGNSSSVPHPYEHASRPTNSSQ